MKARVAFAGEWGRGGHGVQSPVSPRSPSPAFATANRSMTCYESVVLSVVACCVVAENDWLKGPHLSEVDPEFIKEFTKVQRRLYLFVLSQVPSPVDAEEVLQESNVILWKKQADYELGTNFFAWAAQIARFEILKHRRRHARSKLTFSDEFLEAVATDVEERSEVLEARRHALNHCLDKLKPQDRELIEMRYKSPDEGKEIARKLGRPANSVYQSIGRIRKVLMECVERTVATSGA